MSTVKASGTLCEQARELARSLDEAFGEPPKPGEERAPYVYALIAVATFARAAGLENAMWRLKELAEVLNDLEKGIAAPLLRPSKRKGGSPSDSSNVWFKRMQVLTAMHALEKSGRSQVDAANYIAKNYPEVSDLMTRGKDLPSTIIRWRRELNEAKKGTLFRSMTHCAIYWGAFRNERPRF